MLQNEAVTGCPITNTESPLANHGIVRRAHGKHDRL
jgi:hypothetical protein